MTRNIRGWILRRNYRRLHHATKTLQNATKSSLSARRERGGGGIAGATETETEAAATAVAAIVVVTER